MLCQTETVPFDFIIAKSLLTTSLAKYIAQHNISLETVLEITVVKSLSPPEPGRVLSHNDWISSLAGLGQKIMTGGFDGCARVWSLSGECETVLRGHEGPVKCVAWMGGEDSVVTAGQDGIVCAWKVCGLLIP
jgi:WD40 repeat protein